MTGLLFQLFIILTNLLPRFHRPIISSLHLPIGSHNNLFSRAKSINLIILGSGFIENIKGNITPTKMLILQLGDQLQNPLTTLAIQAMIGVKINPNLILQKSRRDNKGELFGCHIRMPITKIIIATTATSNK